METRAKLVIRLRLARKQAGLTQEDAARFLGVSTRTYQAMESVHETTKVRAAFLIALEAASAQI